MTFLIQQTLIYAVPLMIVALAGVFAERSGIINLALEGIMIFGAFIGVLFVRLMQGSQAVLAAKQAGDWVALQGLELLTMLVAAAMGAVFSLLLSFASINLRADQTIGGTALNLMAPALVLFLIRIIANQNTLQMATGDSASWFMLKKSTFGVDKNVDWGFFGETFLNKIYLATYVCILLFIILSVILYKTKFGLRLRACGENPQAADSLGINVYKMRYAGVTISGALAGMGGFVYAMTTANCSSNGDVAGFGFLALAVMIFGNWKPLNIAGASLLFGLFKCIAAAYASIDINGDGVVNTFDKVAIGYTLVPEINYGFGASLKWKGIDVSVFFSGVGHVTRIIGGYNLYGGASNYIRQGQIFADVAENRWSLANPDPNAKYPRMSTTRMENNLQKSTYWQRDMSFLRLKNAEIGYTLPKAWTKKAGLSTVRFYLQGVNLLTFSDFDLWDPELEADYGNQYPTVRTVTLGVNLNF